MPISPWFVGATHIPLAATMLDDSGNPINLTGATVTVRLAIGGAAGFLGTGTMVIVSAPAGTLTYQFSTADIATVGQYAAQFLATYGDGSVIKADPVYFTVAAAV